MSWLDSPRAEQEPHWERYWDWFAVALFLLLTVDLLMTMGAAGVYGLEAEANPLMRWTLQQGVVAIVLVHVATLLIAVAGFELLVGYGKQLHGRAQLRFQWSTELWLGFLVGIGLLVYANNLALIVLGQPFL